MREEEEVAIYIHSLTPSACNLRLIHSRSINRKEEVKIRCFSLKSLTVAWHSYLCNNHSFFCSNKQTTPTTSQGLGLRASNGKKESFPQWMNQWGMTIGTHYCWTTSTPAALVNVSKTLETLVWSFSFTDMLILVLINHQCTLVM